MANSNDKNRPPKFRFQNPVNGLQHHVPSPKPSRGKMRLQRGDLDSNAADFDNASMDSELRMASSLFRDSDQFVERVVTKAVGLPLDGPQPMCDSVREAIESECAGAGADPLQRNHEYPTNIENWVAAVGVAVLIAALVFVLASFAVPTLNDDSELASASQIKNPSEQDLTQRLILLGIAIGIVLYCNIVYCIVWYCNGCVGFNTATDWHFSRLDIRSSTCSPAVPVLIFVISKLSKSRLNSSSFDCSEFLSQLSQSFVPPPAQ